MAEIRTIQLRRGSSSQWTEKNSLLASGEVGVELDTGRMKLGDGFSRWNQLDYFISESRIQSLIQTALQGIDAGGGEDAQVALEQHVQSSTPHPVYDDGPSLRLIYENAKV